MSLGLGQFLALASTSPGGAHVVPRTRSKNNAHRSRRNDQIILQTADGGQIVSKRFRDSKWSGWTLLRRILPFHLEC